MKELMQLSAVKLQRIAALKRQIERLEASLAKLVQGAPAGSGPVVKRQRRKMSAAARKRISDSAKARWAKYRAKKK